MLTRVSDVWSSIVEVWSSSLWGPDSHALKCGCEAGWTGIACSEHACGGGSSGSGACSGHGECNTGDGGTFSCECDVGWRGDQCDDGSALYIGAGVAVAVLVIGCFIYYLASKGVSWALNTRTDRRFQSGALPAIGDPSRPLGPGRLEQELEARELETRVTAAREGWRSQARRQEEETQRAIAASQATHAQEEQRRQQLEAARVVAVAVPVQVGVPVPVQVVRSDV